MNYKLLIPIALVIVSCSEQSKNSATVAKITADKTLVSFYTDSIVLDNTGGNFDYRSNLYNTGNGYNLSIKKSGSTISFVDLRQKTIKVVDGFVAPRSSCYADNKGNYYLVVQNKLKIEKYKEIDDSTATLLQLYQLQDTAAFASYRFWPDGGNIPFRIDSRMNTVLTLLPDIRKEFKDLYKDFLKTDNFATFNIGKEKVTIGDNFGKFPKKYQEGFYGDLQNGHPLATYVGDSIVAFIFEIEPVVFTYNLNNKEVKANKIAGLEDNNLSEIDLSKLNQGIQYAKQFSLENNRNAAFLYDDVKDRYIVIRGLKTNMVNDDGTLNEYLDKKFEINVIDRKTNTVKAKYTLDNKSKYVTFQSFMFDGKLYLPRVINGNEPLIADIYAI